MDVDEVTLGAYGDRPIEARSGVVAPSPYYVIIDGGDRHCQPAYDRYEAGGAFQEWYGAYGAEHHMRAGSIARCFPQIPGAAHPADRARRMVEDLRRQGAQLKPQTCEEMQERDDPWGNRDATSMFKEVGNSAETKYDNDMYVASQMANRWKEIHWLQHQ